MSAKFFLGIDVSKKTLSALLTGTDGKALWSGKTVPNNEAGFGKLVENVKKTALRKAKCNDYNIAVGMESTGVYGENLAYYLSDNNDGGRIVVYELNPYAVKAFRDSLMGQNKNDAADAAAIAAYLPMAIARGQITPWVAPAMEVRQLKELSRRRGELIALLTEETNRLEKLENAHAPYAPVTENVESHVGYLEDSIKAIEEEIERLIDKNDRLRHDVELLRSIPGIGPVNSVTVTSEIGDITRFSSVKKLVSFVGVAPVEHTSGTSVYRHPKISRCGSTRVRSNLYMAALVASQVNPVIRGFYERLLEKGKNKKLALTACVRKLLHIIWGVLKNRRKFDQCYALK